MQETRVQSLGQEDALEREMATHSSIIAWRIPMDRGASRAAVHGVTKSQTWLNTHTHIVPHTNTHTHTAFLHLRKCLLLSCNLQKLEKQALPLPGRVTICGAGSEMNADKKRKTGSVECGALHARIFWWHKWESWSETINYDNFWFQPSTLLLKSKLECYPMILTWFGGFLILT